jgi:hypothetical protein
MCQRRFNDDFHHGTNQMWNKSQGKNNGGRTSKLVVLLVAQPSSFTAQTIVDFAAETIKTLRLITAGTNEELHISIFCVDRSCQEAKGLAPNGE